MLKDAHPERGAFHTLDEPGSGVYVDSNNTGTDPLNADTDGDGFDDGFEIVAGSDPNDSGSTPSPQVHSVQTEWLILLCMTTIAVGVLFLQGRDSIA